MVQRFDSRTPNANCRHATGRNLSSIPRPGRFRVRATGEVPSGLVPTQERRDTGDPSAPRREPVSAATGGIVAGIVLVAVARGLGRRQAAQQTPSQTQPSSPQPTRRPRWASYLGPTYLLRPATNGAPAAPAASASSCRCTRKPIHAAGRSDASAASCAVAAFFWDQFWHRHPGGWFRVHIIGRFAARAEQLQ